MQQTTKILLALVALTMFGEEARAFAPGQELLGHLRFEENHGGANRDARFVAYGPRYFLSLAPSESRLDWSDPKSGKHANLRTRFAGANRNARMEAHDRLPGLANYFVGPTGNWRSDVQGFGRVQYHDLYPGIDLVFHGDHGQLEYDFVLAPNADTACDPAGIPRTARTPCG